MIKMCRAHFQPVVCYREDISIVPIGDLCVQASRTACVAQNVCIVGCGQAGGRPCAWRHDRDSVPDPRFHWVRASCWIAADPTRASKLAQSSPETAFSATHMRGSTRTRRMEICLSSYYPVTEDIPRPRSRPPFLSLASRQPVVAFCLCRA